MGGVGCAIFLFLSGYGLSESYKKNGLKGFWKKKMLRVVLPYVLAISFFYLSAMVSPLINDANRGALHEDWWWSYYWFVKYIVIWYVVFWIVYFINSKHSLLLMWTFAVVSFFMLHSEYMVEQSFSFVLGATVSRYRSQMIEQWDRRWLWIIAMLMLIVGIVALGLKQLPAIRELGQLTVPYNLLQLLIKLPLAIFVMIAVHSVTIKDLGLLVFFGMISYELYMVQMPYTMFIQGSYTNALIFLIQAVLMAYILYKTDNWIINKCLNYFK